jgi:hypothetical protein
MNRRISQALFFLLFFIGLFLLHIRHRTAVQFPLPQGETALPAWDWIVWQSSPEGLKVKHVYNTAMNTPGSGIMPGDILKRIEYKPVPDPDLLSNIHAASAPGQLMIYQVDRNERTTGMPTQHNYFVSMSFKPFLGSPEWAEHWSVQTITAVLIAFFILLILLILLPFLRQDVRKHLPVFNISLLLFIFFTLLAFRNLRIRLEFASDLIEIEQGVIFGLSVLLCFWSLLLTLSSPIRRAFFIWVPSALGSAYFLYLLYISLWITEDYRQHALAYQYFLLYHAALHVFWYFRDSATGPLGETGGLKWLSLGLTGLVLFGSGWMLVSDEAHSFISASLLTLAFPVLSLPVLDLSASRIRFGKTTLVLTRTIQYLLFAGSVLVLYLLVHYVITSFYPSAIYLHIPEVLIVIFLILVFRGIYHRFQPFLRRLGISFQQRQAEGIVEFMARVPRYSHSQDLIQDARVQIEKYFNARKVVFWLDDQTDVHVELPDVKVLMEVYRQFKTGDAFWSANKELSPRSLSDVIETELVSAHWALILPMRFSGAKAGLLMIGRKQKGVYNLEDIDMLKRLNTQIWLTLDILYLLENEKLLMQKTMEANLTALRSQINPHFLFNTLNTIASLIHDNPGMAELAVENLAFIFRYTLKTSGENFVTVENEMTLVRKYLEIEQFRFGDNIEVNIDVSPECNAYAMPALVIQTIVENCIKHGITKIIGKGIVSIRIFATEDAFVTEIEDNGPGIRSDRVFKGTGLNNIHSRLHSLYDRQDMVTFENTGHGTRVTLTLPKQIYER